MMNKFLLTAFTATILATASAVAMEPEEPTNSPTFIASPIPQSEDAWTFSKSNKIFKYSTNQKESPIHNVKFYKGIQEDNVETICLELRGVEGGVVYSLLKDNLFLNRVHFNLSNLINTDLRVSNGDKENLIKFAAECYSQNLIPRFMWPMYFTPTVIDDIKAEAACMLKRQNIEKFFELNKLSPTFGPKMMEKLIAYFRDNPQDLNAEKLTGNFTSNFILTCWEESFCTFGVTAPLQDKMSAVEWISNNQFIDPQVRDKKVKEWNLDVERLKWILEYSRNNPEEWRKAQAERIRKDLEELEKKQG